MHTVWKFLLDDDFLHSYKYGMVLRCQDEMEQHIYPRIFTYSADYPEKWAFLPFLGFLSKSFTYLIGSYLLQFETKAFVRAHAVSYPKQSSIDLDLCQIARIASSNPASTTQRVLRRRRKLFMSWGNPLVVSTFSDCSRLHSLCLHWWASYTLIQSNINNHRYSRTHLQRNLDQNLTYPVCSL